MSKNEAEAPEVPVINVAKISTCESLSGLSTLEYHVGYEASNPGNIHIRIWKTTGGARFNTDWVSLSMIEKVLAKVPPGEAFKAAALNPIMAARSVNTPYMIGAALVASNYIVRTEGARTYERGNVDMWQQSLRALIEAGTNLVPVPIDKPAGNTPVAVDEGKTKLPKKLKSVANAQAAVDA